MFFRTLPILTALTLATTPALIAQAANPKADIQANYNRIAAAFARKDVKSATSYCTDDYVSTTTQGTTRSATELRDYYTPLLRQVKVSSSKITIQSFTAQGNEVEVVAKQRSNMTFGSNKIVAESTFRDTWVKTASGWRIQRNTMLSENNTVNGKPVSN
jgi:predicted SnoaL-like aldol condensation-catalyzing enzyme